MQELDTEMSKMEIGNPSKNAEQTSQHTSKVNTLQHIKSYNQSEVKDIKSSSLLSTASQSTMDKTVDKQTDRLKFKYDECLETSTTLSAPKHDSMKCISIEESMKLLVEQKKKQDVSITMLN